MKKSKEISTVAVPVAHYSANDERTDEPVVFSISREDSRFKAIPMISREERLATGLPEEITFVYINYCIVAANNMDDETLDAIKQIILELEVQDYFD